MKIGVLSFQGDYINHINILDELQVESQKVRYPIDLDSINALIIPGGESTAISNLIDKQKMYDPIKRFIKKKPVYGTCAGLILLASTVMRDDEIDTQIKTFNLLNLEVKRNGWGRQVESFSANLDIKSFTNSYKAIFIRAPKIISRDRNITVLSEYSKSPTMIKKGHILGTTFHPELTKDTRIHEYFIKMIKEHIIAC